MRRNAPHTVHVPDACGGSGRTNAPTRHLDRIATAAAAGFPVHDLIGRRFLRHVDTAGPVPTHDPALGPCWLWTGAINSRDGGHGGGYGVFRVGPDRLAYAHVLAYEWLTGAPVPPGLQVDHLCHDHATCAATGPDCPHRRCVRHLRAATPAENVARSGSIPGANARKTHCDAGHEFTPDNTYIHPQRGWRHCRRCQRARAQEWANRQASVVLRDGKLRAVARRDTTGGDL